MHKSVKKKKKKKKKKKNQQKNSTDVQQYAVIKTLFRTALDTHKTANSKGAQYLSTSKNNAPFGLLSWASQNAGNSMDAQFLAVTTTIIRPALGTHNAANIMPFFNGSPTASNRH